MQEDAEEVMEAARRLDLEAMMLKLENTVQTGHRMVSFLHFVRLKPSISDNITPYT